MAVALTGTATPVETEAATMAAAAIVMAEVEAMAAALVVVAVDMEATHSSKFFLYSRLDGD